MKSSTLSKKILAFFSLEDEETVVYDGKLGEEFFAEAKEALRQGKRVFFCCENPLGLKYFAGALPEAGEKHFSTLEGLAKYQRNGNEDDSASANGEKRNFYSQAEIQKCCKSAGLSAKFYYPYPDFEETDYIFTDARGPREDDFLRDASRRYDRDLQLFHEGNVAIQMERAGAFGAVANSYLVELCGTEAFLPVTYVKFSDQRAAGFQIKTTLTDGEVKKSPLTDASAEHLKRMAGMAKPLQEVCDGSNYLVSPIQSVAEDGTVTFPLHRGRTLDAFMDERLMAEDVDGAIRLLSEFISDVEHFKTTDFVPSQEFRAIFWGDNNGLEQMHASIYPEGTKSLACTDIDFVPSNVICSPDGVRYIIDYEWTFDFPVPLDFLIYRIIRQYIEAKDVRRQMIGAMQDDIYQSHHIDEKKRNLFVAMEDNFQKHIHSGYEGKTQGETNGLPDLSLEVYFDYGDGFIEEQKQILGLYEKKRQQWQIAVPGHAKSIRIDPAKCPGILKIETLTDENGKANAYKTNMKKIGEGRFYCETDDPWLVVKLHKGQEKVLVSYVYEAFQIYGGEALHP